MRLKIYRYPQQMQPQQPPQQQPPQQQQQPPQPQQQQQAYNNIKMQVRIIVNSNLIFKNPIT